MFNEDRVKALIELLDKEPNFQRELKEQLAKIIKTQPAQFKAFINKDFGAGVSNRVSEVINSVQRESLGRAFKWYFERRDPSVLEGAALIARFIKPNLKDADILASFTFLKEKFEEQLDNSFDIFHKAEVFGNIIFKEYGFKVEALSADPRIISLPDVIRTRKTTAFGMAVLYLILAASFEILADITDVAGKPIVRFRDMISFEPVYIDITARGQFVSEDECHIYAAGRGLDWDSRVIRPFTNKQVIKRLLSNLVYVYSKDEEENAAALNFLRQYLTYAK